MTPIKHIHSSGRYDRPAAAIRRALASYAERGVHVLTLTEHNNAHHRAVTAEWAAEYGYEVAQGAGAAANCAIAVHGDRFRILDQWTKQLTGQEQRRGPGGPPPPESITALVADDRSGRVFLVSCAHLPSNVEGDWSGRGGFRGHVWRVFVWRDANKTWRRHVRQLRREHRAKVMLVADWNLNFERRRFRALLRTLYPGLRLTWRRFPGAGTHHSRIIDATVTNMRVAEPAYLLPDDGSSDHRPYAETLAL